MPFGKSADAIMIFWLIASASAWHKAEHSVQGAQEAAAQICRVFTQVFGFFACDLCYALDMFQYAQKLPDDETDEER